MLAIHSGKMYIRYSRSAKDRPNDRCKVFCLPTSNLISQNISVFLVNEKDIWRFSLKILIIYLFGTIFKFIIVPIISDIPKLNLLTVSTVTLAEIGFSMTIAYMYVRIAYNMTILLICIWEFPV